MSERHRRSSGNYRQDLIQLLEALNEQLLIELGKPPPADERRPKGRAASCPACHNRALLDRPES